jgi:hypothetical protein
MITDIFLKHPIRRLKLKLPFKLRLGLGKARLSLLVLLALSSPTVIEERHLPVTLPRHCHSRLVSLRRCLFVSRLLSDKLLVFL